VDVGGSSTEVALLRGGGVEGTRMFNLGGRMFTRRLALALGISPADAEARKLRHGDGLLNPQQDRQVREVLIPDVDVLLQGLNLCLRELGRGEELPLELYFAGGGSLLPELIDRAAEGGWTRGLNFAGQLAVGRLEPEDVQGVADASGQVSSPQDVAPLALANHALRTEVEERDEVNGVMAGVLRSMHM
jgi:cell division protein FtsA